MRKGFLVFSSLFFSLGIMGIFALAVVPQIEKFFDSLTETLQLSVMETLENATESQITYSTLGPSIFRYLEIRDFTFQEDDVAVSIERIRVYYRMADLLRGNFFSAPEDIRVENGSVTVKIPQGQSIKPPTAEEVIARVFEVIRLIPGPTDIFYRRIRLDISDEVTQVITNFDQGNLVRGESTLDLRTHAQISVSQGAKDIYSSEFDLRLSSVPSANSADAFLRVFSPVLPFGTLEDVNLVANLTPTSLSLSKAFDQKPFDLSATSDLEFSRFDFQFLSENWSPYNFVTFNTDLTNQEIESLLAGQITGDISASLELLPNSRTSLRYGGRVGYEGEVIGTPLRGIIDVTAVGDNDRVLIDSLTYEGKNRERLIFSGQVPFSTGLPEGFLSFSTGNLLEFGSIDASVELEASSQDGLRVRGSQISIFDVTLLNPSFDLAFSNTDFELQFRGLFPQPSQNAKYEELRKSAEPGIDLRVRGLVPTSSSQSFIEGIVLDGRIRSLSLGTLEEIGKIFLPTDENFSLPFSAEARFDTRFDLLFSAGLPELRISQFEAFNLLPEIPEIKAQGSFVDSVVIIDFLRARNNFSSELPPWIEVEGRGILGHQGTNSFYLRSFLIDSWIDITGLYSQNFLALSSNLGITGEFDLSSSEVAGVLSIRNFSPPGVPALLAFSGANIDLKAKFLDYQHWTIDRLRGNVPLAFDGLQLALSGNSDRISIEELLILQDEDAFQIRGSLTLDDLGLNSQKISGEINVANRSSNESLGLVATLESNTLIGRLGAENVLLQRFPLSGLRGTGALESNFLVPLEDLFASSGSVRLELTEGLFNLDPLRGSLTLEYDKRGFSLAPTILSLATTTIEIEEGSFLLDPRIGSLGLRINEETIIRAQAVVPENLLDESLDGLVASLSISPVPSVLSPEKELQLSLTGRGREVNLVGGPQQSIRGRIDLDGELELVTSSPMLIQLHAQGRIRDGEFDVNIPEARWVDADLSTIFDFEIFTIQRGNVSGNLRLSGDINDPSFFGSAGVEGFVGNLLYSPTDLGPGNAFIILEDKNLYFPEFRIPAGPGVVTAEGVLGFNRWTPETFEFDVTISDPGIEIDYDFDSIVVDGNAYGSVQIRGDEG
ncbi:MAG: hypothetical protein GW949_10415, partial [Spirochaetales bacterium]|nr:hypothetical protein [Spirochaetales bacterium]